MGKGKRLRAERKASGEKIVTYCLTQKQLDNMCTRYVAKKVEDGDWVKADTAGQIATEWMLQLINAGIKEIMIALMESGSLGWSRIQRDIVPRIKEIDAEWTECLHGDTSDFETAFDILEARLEHNIKTTTRRLRDADGK